MGKIGLDVRNVMSPTAVNVDLNGNLMLMIVGLYLVKMHMRLSMGR